MEKVARICNITGRMEIIAENLTTEQAKTIVKMMTKEDGDYAQYVRLICKI